MKQQKLPKPNLKQIMTKTEREIVEEIFNKYNDLTIKEWIAEGIKAGRESAENEFYKELGHLQDFFESKEAQTQLQKIITPFLKQAYDMGRKQLAEEYLKKIQIIYEDCNDERIQSIQFKIGDLGKELQKEAEK